MRFLCSSMLLASAVFAVLASFVTAQSVPAHWAFMPPQKNVPAVQNGRWCRDEIDRCVLAGLEARDRQPSPEADPATLLRRLHLVLTGLPPTPLQVAGFVADPSEQAYVGHTDRLLQSEACAEHIASTWLDLARFADTYGYQSDFNCRTWPWRDWLIRSFHRDKPWDQFVREILAGDLVPDRTNETVTATAFWRLHRQTNEGGSIEEEWRHEYISDRVDTFGTTFLGLTIGCARCHDHKSDPISQKDYYALGSFFAVDESGLYPYSTGGIPQPTLRLTTPAQDTEIARLRQVVAEAEALASKAVMHSVLQRDRLGLGVAVEPTASYAFDAVSSGKSPDAERPDHPAKIPSELRLVTGHLGSAIECDGDARITVPGVRAFTRADPFSLHLRLWCPDRKKRAVVLHTSNYTLDADTQGYQILLRDGRLCWDIVHHWPGSAIALRTEGELPLSQWVQVVVTYDGSSRAAGLAIWIDGERAATTVVRDHLDGPATVRKLVLGARSRDRGFAGGRIDDFMVFEECLSAAQVAVLAGQAPAGGSLNRDLPHDAVLREARVALHTYIEKIPELMVMAKHQAPPERFVLSRGAYDEPDRQQPVTADVPARVFGFGDRPRNRLGLAAWLVDEQNPLANRVVVDRLWAQCFGRGLTATPDNFGPLGDRPEQQVLLDALACDFGAQHSIRAMLRRIVCSATFRQSSTASWDQRENDPDNVHLARGPSFRLSAEVLRDQVLAASQLLHSRVGGPSCKPWQPPGLWRDAGAGWGGADYKPDKGPNAHRRSLYTYRKRTAPPPNMIVLDAPSRETCLARRHTTDTPLQALTFWNDPVFTECAEALAALALAELPEVGLAERVRFVFASLAARQPRPAELEALLRLVELATDERQGLLLCASTLMASDAVVVMR